MGGSAMSVLLSRKRVYLCYVGTDQRAFPYVEHIAWALRQIPTCHVSVRCRFLVCEGVFLWFSRRSFVQGPIPLPRKQLRVAVLSSPFKFGSARETWEKRSYKRMIVYETDARTHAKVKKFLLSVMEPSCALRMAEHSFHTVDSMFRKELFTGDMGKAKQAEAKQ